METIIDAARRLTEKLGEVEKAYEYRDAAGHLLFCNLRIRQRDGKKTFRMMSDAGSGFELKRQESLKPQAGWPLYGLASLDRSGPVWVVEGEKDVRSLYALGLPAVTSGSTSTDKDADWTALAGREVVLWPDNDDPGRKYMERIATFLSPIAAEVSLIDVSLLGLGEKEDCSDWLAKRSGTERKDLESLPKAKADTALSVIPRAELVRGDMIAPIPVDWLWEGWLAAGKLHLLGGQPGTGKTTIALALAATITIGGRWPDGARAQRGSVVIWSGEDDPQDTIAPRLIAAGADMSKVHIVTGVREGQTVFPFDPARDTESLRLSLQGLDDLRLMVVDPIVSAIAGDSHKNAEVRRGLQPLVDLAQQNRCALIGVTHFSKGTGGREPVERITGSLAFGALARIVLVTAKREPEDGKSSTRFLARAKSNIGPDGGGYVYDLAQGELMAAPGVMASSILWGEELDGTARELLAQAETQDNDEAKDAAGFLRELLQNGPMAVKEVKRQALDSGLAWRTVQRAMNRAGVESRRGGFGQPATWSLCSRATLPPVAPFAPNNLCGVTGATDGATVSEEPEEFDQNASSNAPDLVAKISHTEPNDLFEVGRI